MSLDERRVVRTAVPLAAGGEARGPPRRKRMRSMQLRTGLITPPLSGRRNYWMNWAKAFPRRNPDIHELQGGDAALASA